MTETHPQNRRLGYARVSTYGQTLNAQLEQLRGAGCSKIYREKVTGAHSDRRELLKMLHALAPGDVVTVTRIDRLARSTFDLFAIVKQIVDAKAQFRSLAEPWADTGTSTGRLMLAVLGGLADVERDLKKLALNAQQLGKYPAFFGTLATLDSLIYSGEAVGDLSGTAQGFRHLTQKGEAKHGVRLAEVDKAGAQQPQSAEIAAVHGENSLMAKAQDVG